MNTTHTPEPWTVGGRAISDTTDMDGEIAFINSTGSFSLDEANASRIVACVNACAGMEDPAAEIERLKAQRDELLAALELAELVMDKADIAMQGADATIQRNALLRADATIQRDTLLEAIKSHLDLYNAGLLTNPQLLEEHTLKLAEIYTTINS